ncbi:MAG: hypothetical protein ACI9XO_004491 [Paraglaciecola sp.]
MFFLIKRNKNQDLVSFLKLQNMKKSKQNKLAIAQAVCWYRHHHQMKNLKLTAVNFPSSLSAPKAMSWVFLMGKIGTNAQFCPSNSPLM